MLTASFVLRSAIEYERTCEFICSEIAIPAASSAALLIRMPLESLWKLVDSVDCVEARLRCASRTRRWY